MRDTTGTAKESNGASGPSDADAARSAELPGQPAGGRSGSWRGRLLWTGALAVAAVALYVVFLRISWTYTVNSDGAAGALQAWDMLHGNVLLRGWWTADVSFYTFEIPIEALTEAVRGLGIGVVHIEAAAAYTLLVVVTALLARGTTRGGAGVIAAVVAAAILLAPGDIMSVSVLLGSPDHIGVGAAIGLTFLLVDRAPSRWWVAPAACVVLVWAQLDDPMASFAAAFALAVVCLGRAAVGLARTRDRAAVRYDAALGATAVASYLLTRLAVHLIRASGGFSMRQLSQATKVQPLSAWPHQLLNAGRDVLILFGADFWDEPDALVRASTYVHLVGVALAAAGLVAGIAALVKLTSGDRITQTLTMGTLVTLAAGAFVTPLKAGYDAHEIAVVLPFGAALAGRFAGPWLMRQRRLARSALIPAGSVLLAACLAFAGYFAARPALNPPTRVTTLDSWLLAHHLTDGLGRYWTGCDSRLESGGKVRISPVDPVPNSPYPWIMKPSWFDPAKHRANFVVAGADPAGGLVFSPSAVEKAFGKPARVYRFDQFAIMVYNRNLLRDVWAPAQPNPDTGSFRL